MPLSLAHTVLFHTAGLQGVLFTQQAMMVFEVINLSADIGCCADIPALPSKWVAGLSDARWCRYAPHDSVLLHKGNSIILRMRLYGNGVPMQNLAAAISASCVSLRRTDNAYGFRKSLSDMLVNNPEIGVVSIPLSSVETAQMEGEYDVSIQFVWGPADALEWKFKTTLNVPRDYIPFTRF